MISWVSFALLPALLGLSVWNVTRSAELLRARQAYARSELVSCLQRAQDHLQRRPWSREAKLLTARCLSQLDYANEAEPYYASAQPLDQNDLQIRAFGLVRGNHRQRAIEAYEEILARWPENVTALRRLAAVQLTVNNLPQLEALADRLIHTPGGMAMGYTLRGAVAHNEKNREGAIIAFTHVLEVDPDLRIMPLPRLVFWNYFADDLIKVGRLEDATRYLSKVVTETPNTELLNMLGQAYVLQGMLDEAERCYHEAINWEPDNYLAHARLGEIELQRQRPQEALKHLETAHNLAPRQLDLLFRLSSAYRLVQRPAEAMRIDTLAKEIHRQAKSIRNPKDPWPPYAL
jgi:tetratricopeptide (TPR) repeat protein